MFLAQIEAYLAKCLLDGKPNAASDHVSFQNYIGYYATGRFLTNPTLPVVSPQSSSDNIPIKTFLKHLFKRHPELVASLMLVQGTYGPSTLLVRGLTGRKPVLLTDLVGKFLELTSDRPTVLYEVYCVDMVVDVVRDLVQRTFMKLDDPMAPGIESYEFSGYVFKRLNHTCRNEFTFGEVVLTTAPVEMAGVFTSCKLQTLVMLEVFACSVILEIIRE